MYAIAWPRQIFERDTIFHGFKRTHNDQCLCRGVRDIDATEYLQESQLTLELERSIRIRRVSTSAPIGSWLEDDVRTSWANIGERLGIHSPPRNFNSPSDILIVRKQNCIAKLVETV